MKDLQNDRLKPKYFIFYSNNHAESVMEINDTLIRMIENGMIILIYDIEKNELKGKTNEGIKDIKIPFIK
jgi:hypothetical protein